jgi:alpha-beta hydrolase superfamily lysophospholipase
LVYHDKSRLKTAVQLHLTTESIAARLHEYDAAFLVLHGKADTLTDPAISEELYTKAASTDKAIKLYDGMLHGLFAEPEGGGQRVTQDMIDWIFAHA